jgi:protocatechuate 3,4-dioxygenase beta subunit
VLDPERKPVAGASVCAWAEGPKSLITAETQVPRCAKTDAEGVYALSGLFPATPLAVSAAAPGFAPVGYRAPGGETEIRLGDGEQRTGVDIVLRAGGIAVKGNVIDVTGGAVAGAFVASQDGANRALTTSDAKGDFTLWVEPGTVGLTATAPGYAPGWAHGHAPGHYFKIHLVPGSTLVGRTVIVGSETPVAGVFVEGIQVEGGGSRASARTDDEGRFRIEGLAPGRYRVEAASEGREGYSRASVVLGLGETSSEVVVELDPAYVVRGRVVDKATREPCRGGQVVITDTRANEFSLGAIEPDGWVRMASVIPGTYRVEVRCNDHVERDDYPKIVVEDRDLPPFTWEVDRGATVRVEVVDGQARPLKRADVWAFPAEGQGASGHIDHAEADGAFLVHGLKPGVYNVSAETPEGGRGHAQVTAANGRDERVEVTVPTAGTIEGVVEDEARRPVPNVYVMAMGPGHAGARSLDDGSFALAGLPSGEYEVRTRGVPGADRGGAAKVTLTAPERVTVKLTVPSRQGTIEGRVIDVTGKPVTDAFIDYIPSSGGGAHRLRHGGGDHVPIVTDTDGRFTVEGLADGTYDLRAHREGGVETIAERVGVGTRGVVLKLADGASIAGMLTARGVPVERFVVEVRDPMTAFYRNELFFHASGAFALYDLPAGSYHLEADTPAGTATAEITLTAGEHKSGIALVATLRGDVDGRVVDQDRGTPIAGVEISVNGSSPIALVSGSTRDHKSAGDGRFHVDGVLPGTWTLTVSSPDPAFESTTVPVEVPEGSAVDVGTIRLPRRPPPESQ